MMHEVDFQVLSDDMQFVEVELDPQAAAPRAGGSGREEGSLLGGIGRLLDGDR